MYEICLHEVKTLDPRNDDQPIKGFNLDWLSDVSYDDHAVQSLSLTHRQNRAVWPAAADIRVRTFMHESNAYSQEDQDIKIIPLINKLRQGTTVEKGDAQQWNKFKKRTLERIGSLAKDMANKGLIKKDADGIYQKLDMFKDFWVNRHIHYGPKTPKENVTKPAVKARNPDIYSADNLPVGKNSNFFKTPTAKMVSKDPQTPSTTAVRRPPLLQTPCDSC
jgi:hypothetical protein